VHERYRRQTTDRQTDGRAIAYSEREREFTFAKNVPPLTCYNLDMYGSIMIIYYYRESRQSKCILFFHLT